MVIVLATAWFPIEKASEAGNIFIEVSKKFPHDRSLSKLLINNAISTTKEGFKSVSASEIKEGKLNEYLARLNKYVIFVAKGIEGYKCQIEVMSSIVEAMDVLGLKVPE